MLRRKFIQDAAIGSLLLPLSKFKLIEKTHILSLAFDDGFKKSFYRAAEIHENYGLSASLNVIASGHFPDFKAVDQWILPELLGDFNDWNKLKARGHEVMPHTWEHKNLTKLPLEDSKERMTKCFDYFQNNLDGYEDSTAVYNFAFNASNPDLDAFGLERVRAVRTAAGLVLKDTILNPIPRHNNPVALGCWAHGPDNGDAFIEKEIINFLKGDGGWLIINLHGLDDEGWGPVSTAYLDSLLSRMVKVDTLDVLPLGAVLQKYKI